MRASKWFVGLAAPVVVAAVAATAMAATVVSVSRSQTEPATPVHPRTTASAEARPSAPDAVPKRHFLSKRNSRSKADRNATSDRATPAPAAGSRESRLQAYVTGYSYWDNTPPGSSEISHPRIHEVAGGTGSYADPITVAVGHDLSTGSDVLDWPAGTRFYLPYLQRYFIVEDTCGDGSAPQTGPCHTGYPSPAVTWLDIWVGGQHADRDASDSCMSRITGVHRVIRDPGSGYRVSRGEVTDDCATHGETPRS